MIIDLCCRAIYSAKWIGLRKVGEGERQLRKASRLLDGLEHVVESDDGH